VPIDFKLLVWGEAGPKLPCKNKYGTFYYNYHVSIILVCLQNK